MREHNIEMMMGQNKETCMIALIPELYEEDYKSDAVSQYAPFCQIEKC